MENENQNSSTTNQPVNNQPVPAQPVETPTPEQPKVEAPSVTPEIAPTVEPFKIGKPFPTPVETPVSNEAKIDKTEEAWLNKPKPKPTESKIDALKKDFAAQDTSLAKFKNVLDRLKAKRLKFKEDFPIIYWWAFAGVVIAVICLVLGVLYLSFFYEKPYLVTHDLRCNPYKEKCFVWECDPEAAKGDEDFCTGDAKKDTLYYKMEQRMSNKIPYCDPVEPDCSPFKCVEGEKDCGIVFCEEGNEDEIPCNDPEKFVKENPASGEADFQGPEDSGDSANYNDGEDCVGDECTSDENFPDEVISDESDDAEDLQSEQDALQNAENTMTNGQ